MSDKGYIKKAWRVEFDTEACSLCEICVNRCSNHALIARHKNSELEILFDYHLCDGCLGQTFCQEDCPENAITVTRAPEEELANEPISLIVGEMATCEQCGKQFMPERKLTTLLERGKITPKKVQKYCPSCRRMQLMDSYLKITGQT